MTEERRPGHSRLIYNKATRTIDKVDTTPPTGGLSGAEEMREAACKAVEAIAVEASDDGLHDIALWLRGAVKSIRALPLPATRPNGEQP